MSALVWSDILRLLINTMTTFYMYSYGNMQKFEDQVQTPFCLKEKTFPGFLLHF